MSTSVRFPGSFNNFNVPIRGGFHTIHRAAGPSDLDLRSVGGAGGVLAVAQSAVEDLALAVAGCRGRLGHLRVDVAVADENVGPAIVVEIEKADAPSQEAGVLAETGLIRLVVEGQLPHIAI